MLSSELGTIDPETALGTFVEVKCDIYHIAQPEFVRRLGDLDGWRLYPAFHRQPLNAVDRRRDSI